MSDTSEKDIFLTYLDHYNNWKVIECPDDNRLEYYFLSDPAFRAVELGSYHIKLESINAHERSWMPKDWRNDDNIIKSEYGIKSDKGWLERKIVIWWLDNARTPFPLPYLKNNEWVISKSDIAYKIAKMLAYCSNQKLDECIIKSHLKLIV